METGQDAVKLDTWNNDEMKIKAPDNRELSFSIPILSMQLQKVKLCIKHHFHEAHHGDFFLQRSADPSLNNLT